MDSEYTIEVSVIIPTKTNIESIQDCLESLQNQDFGLTFEIICVSGGNIAQARNHGIREAKGRLCAFIDSDCIATETWLTNLVNTIDKLNAGGVGGPGISPLGRGTFLTALDCVYNSYLGSLGSSSLQTPRKLEPTTSLSSHNCIYKKEALSQVGGFDERYLMNEDTDLSHRVRTQGIKLYVTPEAVVYHKRKTSYRDFTKKFYRYGVSRARAILTNKNCFDWRIVGLLSLFLLGLISSIVAPQISKILVFCYAIVIAYHGIYYTLLRRKLEFVLVLPVLYLLMHTGYAVGLIIGLTKGKYNQNQDEPDTSIIKHTIYDHYRSRI